MALDQFGNYVAGIEPAVAPYPHSECACVDLSGDTIEDLGQLRFVGSEMILSNADIADLSGIVDQSNQSWLEVHGNVAPALISLSVESNSLIAATLQGHLNLTSLVIFNNMLTVLNVSTLPALQILKVDDNMLTALDVTQNPNLAILECSSNDDLGSLDLSANASLGNLNASMCGLTELDLSGNPDILTINLGGNPLTVEAVDNILIQLNDFGREDGTISMLGTATPSAASAAARTSLAGKGWTLTLDP